MATAQTPQVYGWHPGSTRIVAGLIGLVIVAIAAAGLAVALTDGGGGDSLAASTTAPGTAFQRAGAQLDGDGVAMGELVQPAAVVPFELPTVDSLVPAYIAEHEAGIDATLFGLGESGTEVAPYIAEHDAGIDAVLGYEMSEDLGPLAQ